MTFRRETVLPIVSLALFITLIVLVTRRTQQAQRRSCYTVGEVTGWTQTLKNGRDITYRCTIGGVQYTGSDHELPRMNSAPGTRYVVAFDSTNPARHWAYYDMPVPVGTPSPPPTGWPKATFDQLYEAWQQADSVAQTRQVAQQDSSQLVRWQRAQQRQ